MMDDTQLLQESAQVPQEQQQESTETKESAASQPNTPDAPSLSPQSARESDRERNFRSLREKADRIARERDEAIARLKQYEQQPEQEVSLGENDLVEGKHLKKSQSKVEGKIKALEGQLIEARLRADYPDIKTVLSDENLALLKDQYPHLAQTIGESKDLYSQAVSAYTMIRKLGIHSEPAPFDPDRAAAIKNSAKPRPLASVSPQQGDTPLSRANAFANGLTPELQKQLHKEMLDAIKSR